jgi:hypothetical protein
MNNIVPVKRQVLTLIIMCILVGPIAYSGTVGQASTPAGSAFAGACAGNTVFGGVPDPGSLENNGTSVNYGDGQSYFACNYGYSSVGGAVSASAANAGVFNGYAWTNNSSSTAAPKQIHIDGTNVATSESAFAGATASGGWTDAYTLSITDPNVTITAANPVSGYWVVPINVDGSLAVSGLATVAQVAVGAYENGNQVAFDTQGGAAWSYFIANNTLATGAIGSSWDVMQVEYGVDSSLPSLNVNNTIYFALPVTFTSNMDMIDAGIYAQLWLTQSSGGSLGTVTESVDFKNTLGWGGPGQLVLGGNTYSSSQFGIAGASGADYETAFAPEPSTMCALALGLIVLLYIRKRASRQIETR